MKERERKKKVYIKPVSLSDDEISRNAFLIAFLPQRRQGRKEKKSPRETLEVLTNEISRSIVG